LWRAVRLARGPVAGWTAFSATLLVVFAQTAFCQWQVFTWLDKHGNTPVLRENFKHLVSICTVKPVKVPSVQPLQRKSADTSVLDTETAHAQEVGQKLKHQSSMRFVPAAPARPASAASARRRHAVGHRPSTASAGSLCNDCMHPALTSSCQCLSWCLSPFLFLSRQQLHLGSCLRHFACDT